MKSFVLYVSGTLQATAVLAAMITAYLPQGGDLVFDFHIYAYAAGTLGCLGMAWHLLKVKPARRSRLSTQIYRGIYHRDLPPDAMADLEARRDRARRLFGVQ